MNPSDEVAAKCMALASSLLMAFPLGHKQPADRHYLPSVVHALVQTQMLPLDLMPPLSFVASVIQQLSQAQYVDISVLHSCLYQLQIPPLSSFLGARFPVYGAQYPPMLFAPQMHNFYYPSPPQPQQFRHPMSSNQAPPTPAASTEADHLEFSSLGLTMHGGPDGGADPHERKGSPVLSENDQELSLGSKHMPSFGMICSPRHRLERQEAPPETDECVDFGFAKDILLNDFEPLPTSTATYSAQDNDGNDGQVDDPFHRRLIQPFLDSLHEDGHKKSPTPSTSSEHSCDESDGDSSDNGGADQDPISMEATVPLSPPKRRYLYDAPTPLEIQKQSLQIHIGAGGDVNTDELRAATTSWVARMHEQGHFFDEKAALKFHELATADPLRAVGITVSFDLRKDTIQNKSAWLSRACFNCQRKVNPPIKHSRSRSGRGKATKTTA
ncbi:hypothetical protein ACHHYP_16886 [Achlya hypogyna]|uniref:Uncharacterized protein n=1 Tax=Achlya hypogyna TaxID=1202772 RepID=A0A1V9Y5H8_ACHHY|nr:hypothetical protein ACHHYP_16886 [Achlya hypogyna]